MTSTANAFRLRRQIVLGALALYVPACTTWEVGTPTPAEFVSNKHPDRVQVTRTDGTKFELRSPLISNDSLSGKAGGGLAQEDSTRTIELPLNEVQSVAVQKTSTGETVGVIAAVSMLVGIIALASGCGDSDSYGGC